MSCACLDLQGGLRMQCCGKLFASGGAGSVIYPPTLSAEGIRWKQTVFLEMEVVWHHHGVIDSLLCV